ncbi:MULTISPECIES: hypothetical protein [Nitrosopumilus]|nr:MULTISPECIES: hypothetical protein [Nitrosopumilus]
MDVSLTKQKNHLVFVLGMFSVVMVFATTPLSFAESQDIIPLDENKSLEKIVTKMTVPKDNTLPWGTVRGTINNPAYEYPVIIQFFNEESGIIPVHVAQVGVNGDDTYEYKFRVRSVDSDSGKVTNIFEGDYTVKIFKVVKALPNNLDTI